MGAEASAATAISRIGVDVGGTFTDLVYLDASTGLRVTKGLTVPAAPDEGVISLLDTALSPEELGDASMFVHATTVALNTLLQRAGAKVGLITTRGFRDVLELRRGERVRLNDPLWRPEEPLVPRRLRLTVTERLLADGTVRTPLERGDAAAAAAELSRQEVEAVAVVLLHAYRNPVHELEVERLLLEAGFEGEVVLSHRVSGEYREYERTSTTVVDAYVRPTMSNYLGRLERSMRSAGFDGQLLAATSGGGSLTFTQADASPCDIIQSGPAGGAVAAAELCGRLGIEVGILADVGGTSFDTALVTDGQAAMRYEGEVEGLPVQKPWLDVRSIGAGGGSVIHLDQDGALRVGPRSAGSDPGPAAYGRGGREATATDAATVLGMLAFGELGGGVRLDVERARAALEPTADALSFSVDAIAAGALTLLSSTMANAIREVAFERGHDPRRAAVVAVGGAGPLFATLVAGELESEQAVIPRHAGVFSAWGLLGQDLHQSAARTVLLPLSDDELPSVSDALGDLLAGLRHQAEHELAEVAFIPEASLDVRYVGQEYPLSVAVRLDDRERVADAATEIATAYLNEASRAYGYRREAPMQVVSVRAALRAKLPRREATALTDQVAAEEREIDAHSFTRGERIAFRVIDRGSLLPTTAVSGPAILTDETATTYIDAGWKAGPTTAGDLILTPEDPR